MAKSIKMYFMLDSGKSLTVSLSNASTAITEEGGTALVDAAMDALMANQPFNATLAAKRGAELVDTTVTVITQ